MNDANRFSDAVAAEIRSYVYRLIDPRNGETFYVGKGKGNRVFAHVKDELDAGADALGEKLQRIRDIRRDGFEVTHVIHRHGLAEETALEVEAALIDAYPEARNIVSGHASDTRGLMHSRQIIERYEAKEAVFSHTAVLIMINQSAGDCDAYEAVRYAWKIDPKSAEKCQLVMAVDRGLIVGVFIADKWLAATTENFPGTANDRVGRWGFVGREAPKDVRDLYLRHRLPAAMRRREAANPIRYVVASPKIPIPTP
jgi:uncharacterized protein